MKNRWYTGATLWIGLALAVTVGCSKEEPEPSVVEPPAEAPEMAEVEEEEVEETEDAEEAPSGPTAETLPIPEDFADEASEDITAKNYKSELAAMEKDLAE